MNTKYYGYVRRKYGDIEHYRTPGSKNGIRRYQNEDGSLTPEGRRHYGVGDPREYRNSAEEASDNAAIERYKKWQNVVAPNQRASHGTYNQIKRTAESAMYKQAQVGAREKQNSMQERRQQAADQKLNADYDARKRREAEAYARQGQSSMQERRQQVMDQKLSADYDARKRREEAHAQARAQQSNMQERRDRDMTKKISSDYLAGKRAKFEQQKRDANPFAAGINDTAKRADYATQRLNNWGKGVSNDIKNFAKSAPGNIQNWANTAGQNVENFIDSAGDALNSTKEWAESAAEVFTNNFMEGFDYATDYVKKNAGRVGQVIGDAAKQSYTDVSKAVSSAVDNVGDFFSNLFKRK